MNEQLSALMDGEIDEADLAQAMQGLRNSADERQRWSDYHLIGDALRGAANLDGDMTARIMESLEDEPVVLAPAPRRVASQTSPLMQRAFALAASVAGVAVVTALAWSGPGRPDAANSQVAKIPVEAQVPTRLASADLQAYLVAHQTHAPSSQGAMHYVKTVSMETGAR